MYVSKCLGDGLRVGASKQAGREVLANNNSSPASGLSFPPKTAFLRFSCKD